MHIHGRVAEYTMVHPYRGILCSYTNEGKKKSTDRNGVTPMVYY